MNRYAVEDGVIFRGTVQHVEDQDAWHWYWDSDGTVAFYDEGWRGLRMVDGANEDLTRRAMEAEGAVQTWDGDDEALTRVARRILMAMGEDTRLAWTGRFVGVTLERDMTLWALAAGMDDERCQDWVREIQAVWNGDIYRIECQRYVPSRWGGTWETIDHDSGLLYGDDAEKTWVTDYPMTEFPAERLIGEA